MGVFKEEAHTFESIYKRQDLVWNDSADFGVCYNRQNPDPGVLQCIESVKQFIELDKQFPDETPFIRKRTVWKDGVTTVIRIAWEKDEGRLHGTQYTISYHRITNSKHPNLIHKGCDAFISVEIERYVEPVVTQRNPV